MNCYRPKSENVADVNGSMQIDIYYLHVVHYYYVHDNHTVCKPTMLDNSLPVTCIEHECCKPEVVWFSSRNRCRFLLEIFDACFELYAWACFSILNEENIQRNSYKLLTTSDDCLPSWIVSDVVEKTSSTRPRSRIPCVVVEKMKKVDELSTKIRVIYLQQ